AGAAAAAVGGGADAVRHGRPAEGGAGGDGRAGARLHALRGAAAGDGLPGEAAVGEHGERVVPARQLHRARPGGRAPARPGPRTHLGSRVMALDDAFLEDIVAHPEDDAPRLIYADWLDEQDAPEDRARAEFIRVQCALARTEEEGPRRWALQRREAE